jgi:choice-of-anchor A domain-containing protein
VGPPSGAFDGNVSVLVGGSLRVGGAALGAEGTVVTFGDAVFARDVPGLYEVGVTALGSQVAPHAGSDMLVVGGNLAAGVGTHVDVGQFLGGDVVVGGGVADGTDLDPHGGQVDAGIANATAPYLDLVGQIAPQSAAYANLPANGSVEVTDGAITLTGDGSSSAQIFTVDGADLGAQGLIGRSLQLLDVPQDATVVVNLTGAAVDLDVDVLLNPEGLPVNPLTDPYFSSLATHLLWNAPSATTVDIGGLAQLPGSLLVATAPSTTTLSGLGTNGRIMVAGDLVHTGAGELHAYPFLPDPQLGCAPDPVHLTSLSLDIVLVDPDNVVDPDRFFEGRFKCTLGEVDVTPVDNTWKMRAGGTARVLSDQIPAGASCTVTEQLGDGPGPFREWADPAVQPDLVVVAKRRSLGYTITNRVRDVATPPTQTSTPTPTPTATPTESEPSPEPPAPTSTPSTSPTPSTLPEPTNLPEPTASPSDAPTVSPTTPGAPGSDDETPSADPPRDNDAAGPMTVTAPFTLRGAFVWGPMLLLSLLTLVVRIRRRPKRLMA